MDNKERAKILQGCMNKLGEIRVPTIRPLVEGISVPILTVQDVLGQVIRDMLEEEKPKQDAGSAEHEEARA